jgi:hypothetical protein
MGSSENGNGNENGDHDGTSALDLVTKRLAKEEVTEERERRTTGELDPLHGWKHLPVGGELSLAQLHAGLISVSEISEAAIEGGIKMAADLKHALPMIEQVGTRLQEFTATIQSLQTMLTACRKDIQFLKDDVRELKEAVQLVPAIKGMLLDVLAKLP